MIEQIKTFKTNTLAFEVIDSFTETDEKLAQKLFEEKLNLGFKTVNVLIKIDEYKISKTETKAFFEDIIYLIRNIKNLGNLAIVSHSKILKALVPIDNFFFERIKKGKKELYFDVSQMDEAFKFIDKN
ncbi:STAS/SEC14 domain-containing protein [Lutibacter citreus]|uniref:STAS/SEC14 domain-containing protein n=1 Tax=Lutibacter citreus TaxID=2138210 RepID=UPI000DBE8BB8|nr:STAS/SEC14 domain-containing protein [Lutibacter citreus]